MGTDSLLTASHFFPSPSHWEWEAFCQDMDVLVVGSGLVGLQAAIHLKQQRPKWRVVIAERSPLPTGASTRNAGFACFGSLTELIDDLSHHSEEEVWSLVEMRWRGLQYMRQQVGESVIDYEGLGGWELFGPEDKDSYEECLDHLSAINQRLREIVGKDETFVRADTKIKTFGLGHTQHLILNQAEGQLHPGRLVQALLAQARALNVEIWQGLALRHIHVEIDHVQVETDIGLPLQPHRVLVATNGFTEHLLPHLPVLPARNQVILTEPIPGLSLRGAFHYDRGYVYFRNVGDRVLLGGARNLAPEAETTAEFGESALIQQRLREILRTVIVPGREVAVSQRWSGILGVGPQKVPIIEALAPQLVVAVRLGGMGVAIGGEVGRKAAEMLIAAG